MPGYQDLDDDDRKTISKMVDIFVAWQQSGASASRKKKPAAAASISALLAARTDAKSDAARSDAASPAPKSPNGSAVDASPAKPKATPTVQAARPPPSYSYSSAGGPDNSFEAFCNLCDSIAAEPSHTGKTKLVRNFITKGTNGDEFEGDVYLVIHLLLPLHPKRVFNMKDKQIAKALSQILHCRCDTSCALIESSSLVLTT